MRTLDSGTAARTLAILILAYGVSGCSDDEPTTAPKSDTTPPVVVGTAPSDGAVDVNCGLPLRVTFSEPVAHPGDWYTQTAVEIEPWPPDGYIEREGNDLVLWHLPFPIDTLVEVTLTTDIADLAGNRLAAPYHFSFRTEHDITPPRLDSAEPAHEATSVATNTTQVRLHFSEPMFPYLHMPAGNVDARMILAMTGEPQWSEDFASLTVACAGGLLPGCAYWAYIEGVTDMAGNVIEPNPTHYWFATAGTRDFYPVAEGRRWFYAEPSGLGAGRLGQSSATDLRAIENYDPSSGTFEEVWYELYAADWRISEKAFLRLEGAALIHLGRAEYRDGVLQATMMWNEPIEYLRMPPQNHHGTDWPFSTSAVIGTTTIELAGSIGIEALTENVVAREIGGTFRTCIRWRVDVDMTRYESGTEVENVVFRQMFFLAEGIGPVMTINEEVGKPSPPDTLTLVGHALSP